MQKNDSLLLQGGRLIDPSQKLDRRGDLLIVDGKIAALDRYKKIPVEKASRVIDATGLWIVPGLMDVHVHLREPGMEYKETIESGSKAAVAGGFTSIACMANTMPVNDCPSITAFIREKAKEVALCRVFPIGAVTKGLKGEELAEIGGMVSEGARAISDDGMPVMNSYLMRKAMDYARAFGVPVISHAEDLNLVGQGVMNESPLSSELGLRGIPAAAEEILVAREIALCRLTRNPLHIAHISTAIAIEHLRRAKDDGLPVTAEATPHHLSLTEESVRGYCTDFKVAPPLRSEKDVRALRKALAEGLVDLIATDHAPHGLVDKRIEFDLAANGLIGLQSAVPLTLKLVRAGVLSLNRWVDALSFAPAKLLGLPYGTLKKGRDADITVIHPTEKWILNETLILSKSRNSPFMGMKMQGRVQTTFVRGKIVFDRSKTNTPQKVK
jgi:dihydroorotase